MNRQRAVKTLALNARSLGNFGDALSLRKVPQGNQQNARFVFIFQGSSQVLGRKIRILAEASNDGLVMGNSGCALHEFRDSLHNLGETTAPLDVLLM